MVCVNKKLIERYPFLVPRDWETGEIADNYDNSYTMLDEMPDGWRLAFGTEMLEELREILVRHNILHNYIVQQIKEKFGALRWYGKGVSAETFEEHKAWLDKYSMESAYTCIGCGKPATRITTDYILPFCEECVKFHEKNYKKLPSPYEYYGIYH